MACGELRAANAGQAQHRKGALADTVDSQTRSRIMSRIRSRDTKPEMAIRRALHARGFRYRLHSRKVAGKPDLVLAGRRAVVFVHGCFWHRHPGCRHASTPSSRVDYWTAKFEANVARDARVREALLADGWRVAIVWECAMRGSGRVDMAADILAAWLRAEVPRLEIG